MNRKTLLTIAAVGIAAGCAGIGVPLATGYLAYGIPSPTRAIYAVADTIVSERTTLEGEALPVTSASSMTLLLNFRRSISVRGRVTPDLQSENAPLRLSSSRMRVSGEVRKFEATLSSTAIGGMSGTLDDVYGNLEVMVSRHGVDEQTSFPAVSGVAAKDYLFPTLAYALFPRLPDVWVEPGGTWVDTVTVSDDGEGASPTTTLISTHTLVGDTLVGGRMLVHMAVATEVTVEGVTEEAGMPGTGIVTGTVNGSVFWDPERRLVAYAEYQRDFRGTTIGSGDASLPAWTITGPTRIWLTS